jgi:hypothetical protein
MTIAATRCWRVSVVVVETTGTWKLHHRGRFVPPFITDLGVALQGGALLHCAGICDAWP